MWFWEWLKNIRKEVKSIPKWAIDWTKQTIASLKNWAEQWVKAMKDATEKVNPFDKESKQKRLIAKAEKARIHNEMTTKIKDALCFNIGRWDMPDRAMVSSALDGFYNNWKVSIDEIIDMVQWLSPDAQSNLIKFYKEQKNVPQEEPKKTKFWKLLTKAVDVVDDASEHIGVGRYEKEEFQDIIIAALSSKPSPDSPEWKTITKINDLVNNQDFPWLVDILQKLSPMNTWDIGRTGAWVLGVMAVTSGWLLPMLAAWLMWVRRIRQAKIKHLASTNKDLCAWIITEIDKRLKGNNISSWAQKRLKEIKELLWATA